MAQIGLILSGCGVNDGTEIHEAVITMMCLDKAKADILFFAPNINQSDVIDHSNGLTMTESRNILTESARIARGNIQDLSKLNSETIDAVIIPGGAGSIKNLSKISINPDDPQVLPELSDLILNMHSQKKPIGFICISPLIAAAVLEQFSPKLTIGNDINTAQIIKSLNGTHQECKANEICIDETNKLVSTPAYMLAKGPYEVYEGISKLVDKILKMCG